jgi:hypothetical protein
MMSRAKYGLTVLCFVSLIGVCAVLAAGWAYEYLISGCLLDMSYTCGQDKTIPFAFFAALSYGFSLALMKMKKNYKAIKAGRPPII